VTIISALDEQLSTMFFLLGALAGINNFLCAIYTFFRSNCQYPRSNNIFIDRKISQILFFSGFEPVPKSSE
jgi:hypothetical protein